MGQFVCYAKQYIFYRISFGLFCCNINFWIRLVIRITIIKDAIIFMTICLIDKMSFFIKPYGHIVTFKSIIIGIHMPHFVV